MSTTSPVSTPTPNPKPRLLQPTSPHSAPLWQPTLPIRSTVDLVTSCVLTLLLCVWTAIHLNIPKYSERRSSGFLKPLFRRLWWMFLGLIAPEFVLYTAWFQFIQARLVAMGLGKIEVERQIAKQEAKSRQQGPTGVTEGGHYEEPDDEDYHDDIELARKSSQTLLPNDPDSLTPKRKPSFPTRIRNLINPPSLELGYYACMGGFEVIVSKKLDSKRKNHYRDVRRTVTPCGTILLSRLGLLPSLSLEAINDKSKADVLTKTLVCIQACWMLAQAVARKVEGLPVTLLELNTIMHVVCALAMYLLWLKKPQDVGTPTIIYDRHKSRPIGTLLSIRETSSSLPELSKPDNEGKGVLGNGEKILRWQERRFYCRTTSQEPKEVWFKPKRETRDSSEQLGGMEYIDSTLFVRLFEIVNPASGETTYITFDKKHNFKYPQAKFLAEYATGEGSTFGKAKITWTEFCGEINHNGGVGCAKKASNFRLKGQIKSTGSDDAGWIAAIIFPAIYGGIHLTPWNAHFPTYLERYLWRLSGFCVAFGVPTLLCVFALADHAWDTANPFKIPFRAFKWVMGFRPKTNAMCEILVMYPVLILVGLVLGVVTAVFGVVLWAMVLAYPVTRLYILVEAFASLRSLPVGAYVSVEWSEMWPHL